MTSPPPLQTSIQIVQNSPLLLDTNILIDALRNRNDRATLLASLSKQGYVLMTSAINVAEVYAGLRTGEEAMTEALLSGIKCIPISLETARKAGVLRVALRAVGRTHTLDDMIVAATALLLDCPLLTENRKDFQLKGLKLRLLTNPIIFDGVCFLGDISDGVGRSIVE